MIAYALAWILVAADVQPEAAPIRLATGNLSIDAIQHSPIGAQPDASFRPSIPTVEQLRALRAQGLEAYEDYIAWGMVEPEEGRWDWSHHEEVYRRVTEAGLVYIPYVWCHFPPVWLRNDVRATLMQSASGPDRCYMLSIYDPRTLDWYERFYRALRKEFGDRLSEVYACLLGPYGEGNYPLPYVDWVVALGSCPPDVYWCGDSCALPAFQSVMKAKHRTVSRLNEAWGTDFAKFDAVSFPPAATSGTVPDFTTRPLGERLRWLDFIRWHHDALLRFCAASIDRTKKVFGADRVSTKPGGNSGAMNPLPWATYNPGFAKMVARKHIPIQSADSRGAYWADKWTSTAYAFYGVPYRTEAAGALDDNAFTARTFTDACCGASRLFTYDFEKHVDTARKWLHLFSGQRTVPDVALLAPTSVYFLNGDIRPAVQSGMHLRDLFDYDVLDEQLVSDGALGRYNVLVVTGCDTVETGTLDRVRRWVKSGGVLVWAAPEKARSVQGESPAWLAKASPEGSPFGEGRLYASTNTQTALDAICLQAVYAQTTSRRPAAAPRLDAELDGLWTAARSSDLLLLNPTDAPITKSVVWRGAALTLSVPAHELVEVPGVPVR